MDNSGGTDGLSREGGDLSATDSWAVQHADCYEATPRCELQRTGCRDWQQRPGTQGELDGELTIRERVPSLSCLSPRVGEGASDSGVSFHSREDGNIGPKKKGQQEEGMASRRRRFDIKKAMAKLELEHLRGAI